MAEENIKQGGTLPDRALPVGTMLSHDQFTITEQLGAGGFGITYRAKDNVLGRTIVIKECFPDEFCVRDGKNVIARNETHAKPVRSIVRMFMREARSLAKLRHPNIVGVHRAFEENETAYMALDLIDGIDLFDILVADPKALSPRRVKSILVQLLDAIEVIHDIGLLHRDISPDNIIIENSGAPVLIDFGAARGDASRHTRAVTSMLVVKDGYSPQEFYVPSSEQLASSDLYALAATFYHVLSGKAPPNSQFRMMELAGQRPDPCVPLAGRINGYSEEFLLAIDAAMLIHPGDRLQSAAKWKSMIGTDASESAEPGQVPTEDVSLELELSLTRLVEETNVEVRRTSQIPPESEEVFEAPKKAPKPAWVDEFNQGMTPDNGLSDVDGDDNGFLKVRWDPTGMVREDVLSEASPEPVSPGHGAPETNWVNRALEKQERIRIEQEQELLAFEAELGGPARPTTHVLADGAYDLADEVADIEVAPKPKNLPLRLIVGMFVCFSFAVFFAS